MNANPQNYPDAYALKRGVNERLAANPEEICPAPVAGHQFAIPGYELSVRWKCVGKQKVKSRKQKCDFVFV